MTFLSLFIFILDRRNIELKKNECKGSFVLCLIFYKLLRKYLKIY